MPEQEQRQCVAQDLGKSPQAFRLYRAAEQMALAQKTRLNPDQWAQLLAALSAFGMALMRIFLPQQVAEHENQSPPANAGGEGPECEHPDGEVSEE